VSAAPSPELRQDDELRHTLRDVLGLMALPAVWRSKRESDILATFAQALEAVIELECVLAVAAADEPIVVCHRAGRRDDELAARARGWFRTCLGSTSIVRQVPCGELGELTAVCEPLAYGGMLGHVVVASRAADFPTARELVVIKTASSLVTNALETARALEEREQALRAKDDFLALLGHELRNPLAPIVTALDLMQLRQIGVGTRVEQVMRRQVEHLRRLVDDLLDVSRVARNALAIQKEPVRIADVIGDAVESTASLFEEYAHELTVHVPHSDVLVDGDPVRLSQAIGNLLINSAKYTPRGGRIRVAAEADERRVVIVVRDNGVGIDPALMPHIFEKFVQGKRHADRKHGGLGIGLSLVRTLVEMHGGTVSAHSAGNGQGAEFVVLLPASQERTVPPASNPHALGAGGKSSSRVLVVDDNVDAAELLVAALESAGYRARMVTDPLAVLAAIAEFAPDLGILDIGMPQLDGYELCLRIRQESSNRSLPLIALTGYGRDSDKTRATAAGFNAHCAKPVKLSALLEQVQALLSDTLPPHVTQ
jgi:signal transduction histidine kinase/CheY-like chemotaxis protein